MDLYCPVLGIKLIEPQTSVCTAFGLYASINVWSSVATGTKNNWCMLWCYAIGLVDKYVFKSAVTCIYMYTNKLHVACVHVHAVTWSQFAC